MSSEWALLRTTLEEEGPEQATSRLVLADWCEDCGTTPAKRARGEFLRVQLELSLWVPDLDRRQALQERERQLLAAHGVEWMGGKDAPWRSWHFERGLAHVHISTRRFVGRSFASRGLPLLRAAWVHTVRPERLVPHLRPFLATPLLAEVPALDLSRSELTSDHLRLLLRSPHLTNLRSLDLANNLLGDDVLPELGEAVGVLPALKRLDLRNNRLSEAGVGKLLRSPLARQLRQLEVHGNGLSSACMRQLAQWRRERGPRDWEHLPARFIDSIGMELALIPPAVYLMGSPESEPERFDDEGPQHRVTITRPFYLGIYPVTQRQFTEVMHFNLSPHGRDDPYQGDYPADEITWNEAAEFCRRLSALSAAGGQGRTYRLPTEAEWEHACRAGTVTPFAFGDTLSASEANFNSSEPYGKVRPVNSLGGTCRVGQYPANAFGLFDMHGNVQEWCADWFAPYAAADVADPQGPASGEMRVLRGGSWFVNGTRCRSARRNRYYPTARQTNYGMRVVMEVPADLRAGAAC